MRSNSQQFFCKVNSGSDVLTCTPISTKAIVKSSQQKSIAERLAIEFRKYAKLNEYHEKKAKVSNYKITRRMVSSGNQNESSFLAMLNDKTKWKAVFHDSFNGNNINQTIWNISKESTGGDPSNKYVQAYTGQENGNIYQCDGKLTIEARAEWYVQDIGCKNECTENPYEIEYPGRAARPYTSGAINTYGNIDIDFGKPGYIEVKFRSTGGHGSAPTIWMRSGNGQYGPWGSSGEIDILSLWHGPVGLYHGFGAPFNSPRNVAFFGGPAEDDQVVFLYANPVWEDDETGTQWHTVQFSWNAEGLFVWKMDGHVSFVIGPSEMKSHFGQLNDPSGLITNPFQQWYGINYLSLSQSSDLYVQPYQGTYVGYETDQNPQMWGNAQVTTVSPTPSPFDETNDYYLMIEFQVGGPVQQFSIAPENNSVYDAGNNVDLTEIPNGPISNYDAEQLGLPARPSAYFTDNQYMDIEYACYYKLKDCYCNK